MNKKNRRTRYAGQDGFVRVVTTLPLYQNGEQDIAQQCRADQNSNTGHCLFPPVTRQYQTILFWRAVATERP